MGSGISDWDTDGVPDPTSSQTDLENEIGRATANVVFLDSSNNSFLTVTNRLSISGTFGPNDSNGPWERVGSFRRKRNVIDRQRSANRLQDPRGYNKNYYSYYYKKSKVTILNVC